MARSLRIQYPGAVYHVTHRGNAREDIFLAREDYGLFLDILSEAAARFHLICHAYCQMSNHYHLILETPEGNLSRAMRHVGGTYTQVLNRRHRRCGHLFQGRYKSHLIERESYLLGAARYVVLNPVRAALVKEPGGYEFSSFRATAGLSPAPDFLCVDSLLAQFSRDKKEATSRYRKFVLEGVGEEDLDVKHGLFLGGQDFPLGFRDLLGNKRGAVEFVRTQRFADRPSLEGLFSPSGSKRERNESISRAHLDWGYDLTEIASHLGLHYSTVSKAFHGTRR